jgi:cellulose synthase/poly-beta-1,6-N-acetylglucosamine synthase-like glycosyltransferase
VIVVDNTAGEREVRQLAAAGGARYLIESRVGMSRARNTGARAARGEIIAYIDDDAVAEPSWLAAHAAGLADSTLTATTGRVLPTSGGAPAAHAYAAIGGYDLGEVPFRVDRRKEAWFEMANFGGVGTGTNIAFRRSLFDAGWGFRESLGPGGGIPGEEHYAFFTLIRDGHAIAYVPDAIVHHDYPATVEALRRRRSRILQGAVAYMAMLLIEEPEFRSDTLRYMWEAMQGVPRTWRHGRPEERFATRLRVFAATCAGLPLYLRNVHAARGRFKPPSVPGSALNSERPRRSVPS